MKNPIISTAIIFFAASLLTGCSSNAIPLSEQSLNITKNLQCSPGNICDFELTKSESVTSVALSNPIAWDATLLYAGKTPHVLLKSKASDSNADLYVLSNLGSYKLLLTSSPGKNDSLKLNKNYTLSGDKSAAFAPSQIYDDGSHVYIRIPNISLQNAPAFYLVNSTGELELVNFRIKDDTYIVEGLFFHGALVLDKQTVFIDKRTS